jgi:hypothetical protein
MAENFSHGHVAIIESNLTSLSLAASTCRFIRPFCLTEWVGL